MSNRMNFMTGVIFILALSFVAADVSHLTNGYLPPYYSVPRPRPRPSTSYLPPTQIYHQRPSVPSHYSSYTSYRPYTRPRPNYSSATYSNLSPKYLPPSYAAPNPRPSSFYYSSGSKNPVNTWSYSAPTHYPATYTRPSYATPVTTYWRPNYSIAHTQSSYSSGSGIDTEYGSNGGYVYDRKY